jgi:hypothetical protein
MKFPFSAPLVLASLLAAPVVSHAALTTYSQDFETLAHSDPGLGNAALSDDGWLVYANVFATGGAYLYGYGAFPAPNGSSGFSGIDVGQGGPQQGNRQLVAYSDYGNTSAHGSGQGVESLVFQQQTVGAGDVGDTWTFRFDAGRYDRFPLSAPSTARAFIKTLDPANGYQATALSWVDMSAVTTWGTHLLNFTITASAGQILQFGFASMATHYAPSAVAYDNIVFAPVPEASTWTLMLGGLVLLACTARRRKP